MQENQQHIESLEKEVRILRERLRNLEEDKPNVHYASPFLMSTVENNYRKLCEILTDTIFTINTEGRFLYLNTHSKDLTGYNAWELIGKPFIEIVQKAYIHKILQFLTDTSHKKESATFELELQKKDGSVVPVECKLNIVRDYKDEASGFIGLSRDISNRKNIESNVVEIEDQYRSLLKYSNDGLIFFNQNGEIVFVNKTIENLFERDKNEFIGSDDILFSMVRKNSLDELKRIIKNAVENKRYSNQYIKIEWHTKSESILFSEVATIPSPVKKNGNTGFQLIIRNITDLTSAETKIESFHEKLESEVQKRTSELEEANQNLEWEILERLNLMQELKRSESLFRLVWENSFEALRIIDDAGIIILVNETYCELVQMKREDLIGRSFSVVYPPDEQKRIAEDFILKLSRNQITHFAETELVFASGKKAWFEIANIVLDESEDTFKILSIFKEITERKKSEITLIEQEELFRALTENTSDVTIIVATDRHISYITPSAEKLLGLSIVDIIDKDVMDFIHPDDTELLRHVFHKMKNNDGNIERIDKVRVAVGNNESIFLEAIITSMINNPYVQGIVANCRDITDRIEAEAALFESEKHLSDFFENAPVGIYRSSADGEIKMANPAMITMLGYDSFDDLKAHIRNQGYKNESIRKLFMDSIKKTGKLNGFIAEWQKKDGSIILVSEHSRMVNDNDGNILFFEGIVENITDRRNNEIELQRIKENLESIVKERTAELANANDLLQLEINDRITIEKALKESEVRYRDLVEKSGIAFLIENKIGEFSYFNQQFCDLFGYNKHEIEALTLMDLVYPEDYEQVMAMRERCLSLREESIRYEFKGVQKNEKIIDIEIEAVPVYKNEMFDGIQNYLWNITERKQLEEKHKISDQILQRAGALVLVSDSQGNITYASPSVKPILGYEPDELLGDGWWEKSRGSFEEGLSEKQTMLTTFSDNLSSHETTYERLVFAKNKSKHWILWQDTEGPDGSIIGIGQDITERKKAEEQLQESQRMLQLVIDNIPTYILWKDQNSIYMGCNNKFAEIAGVNSPADIVGKTDYDLAWNEEETEFHRAWDKHVIDSGVPSYHSLERQFMNSTNQIIVDTNRIPLQNSKNEVVGILITYEDVTQRIQAEEQLKQAKDEAENASKLKTQFVYNISHEIRTPLNAIIGFSETIQASHDLEKIYQHTNTILLESENLLLLINDLLDHAKMEAGKTAIEIIPMNLHKVVQLIESSITVHTNTKNLEFRSLIADNVPQWIMGDPLRLRQILINLLYNAIKFTDEGYVELKISTISKSESNVHLHFEVTDTGIGIPVNKQKEIFQSFTQADGSTTRKFGGTGLGTTIAKNLVELMNGTIDLRSQEGVGSTFSFDIETNICTKEQIPPDEIDSIGKGDGTQSRITRVATILLCEDYLPNQEIARSHLESVGHTVDIAENGVVGVEHSMKKVYDIIFMDVQMPKMDGYETVRRIREPGNPNIETAIIGLTAHADAHSRKVCLETGMDDVITKPIRKAKFLATIEKWLCYTNSGKEVETTTLSDAPASKETPKEKSSDIPPLDFEVAISEFGDPDMVKAIVEQFLDNVAVQIDILNEAIAEKDFELIRKEAHAIKGGAATLEAVPLSSKAKELESLAKEDNIDQIIVVFEQFFDEFSILKKHVNNYFSANKS